MPILLPRNDALSVHPPVGDQQLSTNGSNWLFTVTSIFGFSMLVFAALQFRARSNERIFHYIFIIASFVGMITYFGMASGLGFSLVQQANQLGRSGDTRQIFWPKYVFWTVLFPAVVLALGILSSVSWATMVYHVFLAWTWIVSYLVGAYTPTNYKWGFFAFGTFAYLLLAAATLATPSLTSATRVGVRRDYLALAGWTNLLWMLYPLAWGLTDGGNYQGVTPSFVWFGILDVLLLCGVGYAIVLFFSRRWDYGRLNIAFTQYGRVHAREGAFPEKDPAPATAPGPAQPAPVAGQPTTAAV